MNYRNRHRLMTLTRKYAPATAAAIMENAKMTASRKIDALNASRTIARELGQNPDAKGTARLAEDLGNAETCYTVVQHEGTDLSPFPASIYGPEGEIAAVRNQGSDTARIAYMLAAAPDLLEALRDIESQAELLEAGLSAKVPPSHIAYTSKQGGANVAAEIMKRARAAIAKATKGGEA